LIVFYHSINIGKRQFCNVRLIPTTAYIEPEFTKEMMVFAGYKTKKIYIKTLGELTVYSYNNRNEAIKIRTKKSRELLAYLLNAGEEGFTKEQIYHDLWPETESNDVGR